MAEDQGITVKKSENFSEWYTQVVQKANLADIRFGVQGFIVHKPWGFRIIRRIYDFLEKEVEDQDHVPYLFPRIVKEESLTQEAEHAGFTPEVFWVTEAGGKKLDEKFALPPTGEAQIYPMYALWFRSHRDLPFKGYQSRISVYRKEMTTRPFLRGREFLFFETHNVFNSHDEVVAQIEEDFGTCEEVIRNKIKIPFMYFKRPEWDKFMGADDTFVADTLMPDGKRNQLGSTHDFGQKFSKAYNIKVKGKDEKDYFAWQTAFGPGIWRIMAALIGIHGDDKGLVLPFDMAPIQIVIVPITFVKKKEESKEVIKLCEKLSKQLKKLGYKVKLDDRECSPGEKYNHWEMHGVPLRIEVGPKEAQKGFVSLALRTGGKKQVQLSDLQKDIVKNAEELDKTMHKRAEEYFKNNVREARTLKDTIKILEKSRGFVRVPFCSVEKDGEKCAEKLKEKSQGGNVCGTLYPKAEKVKNDQKCLVCSKEAKHIVYVAKSY
jgi:prolyl-tRNA synthetase